VCVCVRERARAAQAAATGLCECVSVDEFRARECEHYLQRETKRRCFTLIQQRRETCSFNLNYRRHMHRPPGTILRVTAFKLWFVHLQSECCIGYFFFLNKRN